MNTKRKERKQLGTKITIFFVPQIWYKKNISNVPQNKYISSKTPSNLVSPTVAVDLVAKFISFLGKQNVQTIEKFETDFKKISFWFFCSENILTLPQR